MRGFTVSRTEIERDGLELVGEVECVHGGAISKGDGQRKFHVVALSLGHGMIDLNPNTIGYREGKS